MNPTAPTQTITYIITMKIPTPFLPVEVTSSGLTHKVDILGRSITFDANSLPTSIVSQGTEILAEPIRLVGLEDNKPIQWDNNYPGNESESFIQERNGHAATICGAMLSDMFIVNTVFKVNFDGCIEIDMKVMPRGRTVPEIFGFAKQRQLRFELNRLWLEIPLNPNVAKLFSFCPNSPVHLADGTVIETSLTSSAGRLSDQDSAMPFKSLLWIGNDDLGIGWAAENDKNWQLEQDTRVMEIIHQENAVVLRARLLDSQPIQWQQAAQPENGINAFQPIAFSFMLQPTPVKTFPKQPYLHNALHLDCFVKIKGNYIDFMAQQDRYDRLKEMGVDTLILHEKWNKSQNAFELSEFTTRQVKEIVAQCHKRGIKVLTYFGYEISSLNTSWTEDAQDVMVTNKGRQTGGWYRVPFQRDYMVCYNNKWQDRFISGIEKIMDTCHTDGVYLDGTSSPHYCDNIAHGCGWHDAKGNLKGTYPIKAVRRLFQRLAEVVHSRGGMINVHAYGFLNVTALPYIDMTWYGENLQFKYTKGEYDDMPLDYFRAEYCGRNVGVPVEFIAYENKPAWTFENAITMSIIHGILPRPNDIEHPLEAIAPIWNIVKRFPIEQSQWMPYWKNNATTSDERIKVSYYKYIDLTDKNILLAFAANTTKHTIENVAIDFGENTNSLSLLNADSCDSPETTFKPYGYKIWLVE